jgi:hypothetical protein
VGVHAANSILSMHPSRHGRNTASWFCSAPSLTQNAGLAADTRPFWTLAPGGGTRQQQYWKVAYSWDRAQLQCSSFGGSLLQTSDTAFVNAAVAAVAATVFPTYLWVGCPGEWCQYTLQLTVQWCSGGGC